MRSRAHTNLHRRRRQQARLHVKSKIRGMRNTEGMFLPHLFDNWTNPPGPHQLDVWLLFASECLHSINRRRTWSSLAQLVLYSLSWTPLETETIAVLANHFLIFISPFTFQRMLLAPQEMVSDFIFCVNVPNMHCKRYHIPSPIESNSKIRW